MFRVKLSENMAKQLPEPVEKFETRDQAEYFGITKYGSGTRETRFGWYVKEE